MPCQRLRRNMGRITGKEKTPPMEVTQPKPCIQDREVKNPKAHTRLEIQATARRKRADFDRMMRSRLINQ